MPRAEEDGHLLRVSFAKSCYMNVGGRPQVLIVEDEALVRLDLACALADAGCPALAVSNAEHALTVLSILSDVEVVIIAALRSWMKAVKTVEHVVDDGE